MFSRNEKKGIKILAFLSSSFALQRRAELLINNKNFYSVYMCQIILAERKNFNHNRRHQTTNTSELS